MTPEDRRTLDTKLLADAIALAIKEVVQDPEFAKGFWRRGFEEITRHSADASSMWVGKRILTIAVTSLLGLCVVWLVKSGAIK
jgi:hypothetical protein